MIRLRNAPALLLLCAGALGFASCDKAKLAVNAAREKFRGATDPHGPAVPGGEVAPDLASQVDSAAEGVRFRRDLPFPTHLNVRVVQRRTYENARRTTTSALGSEAAGVGAKWELVGLLERRAHRVSFAIERSGEIAAAKDGKKDDAAQALGGSMPKIAFELGPRGWRVPAHSGPADFLAKIREQQLLPTLEQSISQNGLTSRAQWFSASRRWVAGDKLVLEGDSLQVLFPPRSSGKVTLIYEVSEPIDGHPCGRFALSGELRVKEEVSLAGQTADREMSIKSGKVWCSLLHPLVLREELETVMTEVEGSGSGAKERIQGAVKMVSSKDWRPITEG